LKSSLQGEAEQQIGRKAITAFVGQSWECQELEEMT